MRIKNRTHQRFHLCSPLRVGVRGGLFAFLFMLLSCEDKPDGLLSKGKMEDVLYDYHIAQYMASSLPFEERYQSYLYVDAVFEKHGITEAQFDSSLVYYNRHTDEIRDIYEHVQRKLEDFDAELQLQSGSNEIRASFTLGGDTADIWSGRRMMVLRNNPYLNKETFVIHADTSFHLNDRFRLALDVDFIREDQNNRDNNVTACLAVHFKDGKVISNVRSSNFPVRLDLELNPSDMKEVDYLSGYFLFQGDYNNLRALGIVRDIMLYRYHTTSIANSAADGDSLNIAGEDSIRLDSISIDTTGGIPRPKVHSKRLSPDDLRELSIDEKPSTQIRTAPAVRTPNSIGPSRRKKK
ncbi:MAG: DUF4296 domain-containing protein [Bacteroidaceae bacterium]|nr:DUF4296 domain-containing protein [Bacteroidaceae bacterium]